ncbi:hypothetical protein EVAR_54359_1 [Eumeta japonica]|uniref:Uncharacterized protein n=1 Tax=Eumeta variegata TaxID=151549 RepID=A0A4C1Z7Q0_EUMVA|nr:hypothetical protein EVAR_54359_1 [Eumeta japonica]
MRAAGSMRPMPRMASLSGARAPCARPAGWTQLFVTTHRVRGLMLHHDNASVALTVNFLNENNVVFFIPKEEIDSVITEYFGAMLSVCEKFVYRNVLTLKETTLNIDGEPGVDSRLVMGVTSPYWTVLCLTIVIKLEHILLNLHYIIPRLEAGSALGGGKQTFNFAFGSTPSYIDCIAH